MLYFKIELIFLIKKITHGCYTEFKHFTEAETENEFGYIHI